MTIKHSRFRQPSIPIEPGYLGKVGQAYGDLRKPTTTTESGKEPKGWLGRTVAGLFGNRTSQDHLPAANAKYVGTNPAHPNKMQAVSNGQQSPIKVFDSSLISYLDQILTPTHPKTKSSPPKSKHKA